MTYKPKRSAKIIDFPVPKNKKQLRGFLGTIGITKPWVKNAAEISRPLTRLTGNAQWRWGNAEQLSFELLKVRCSETVEMFGVDQNLPIQMYVDASMHSGGCYVSQIQDHEGGKIERPILFDSMNFNPTQRSYGTYKRELLVDWSRRPGFSGLSRPGPSPNRFPASTVLIEHRRFGLNPRRLCPRSSGRATGRKSRFVRVGSAYGSQICRSTLSLHLIIETVRVLWFRPVLHYSGSLGMVVNLH